MNSLINHSKLPVLLYTIIMTIILTASYACAESGIDMFEETAIIPPSLEAAETDIDTLKLILELNDINTKEPLTDIHMSIELISVSRSTKTIKYIGDEPLLELNLPYDEWIIILKGDRLGTSGKDYYATYAIELNKDLNQTIYLLPVGSVEGMVYTNSELTEVVDGAILKFDCNADYGEAKDMSTDTFGSFKSEWLPVTGCRIYAKHGNRIGSTEVAITNGTLSNVQIVLDKDAVTKDYKVQVIIAVFAIIAFIVLARTYHKYLSKPSKKSNQAPKVAKRAKDIMNTLGDREKSIVTFLFENNNESTQNKIYHSTFIPKTSLARSLLLLEQKRIIKIDKLGNLRKIKLTKWFLDEES